jgi:uncharacterized protein
MSFGIRHANAAAMVVKLLVPIIVLQGCSEPGVVAEARNSPVVDHHTHLMSIDALSLLQAAGALSADAQSFASDQIVEALDSAGVERAVIASVGYFFASSYLPEPLTGERTRLQDENDWNVRQAERHPGRLVVFCGLNPLSEYASEEVARCRTLPHVVGVKIHFDNSGVDLLNPVHVGRLRGVFETINENRLAVLVHLRVPDPDYGGEHSRIFLEQVLDAAPDVPVQIAHLAGSGPGYDADDAFLVFAEAAARGDSRLANVYFDVASNVVADAPPELLALIAVRLRLAGLQRILFGSDYAGIMNEPPDAAWEAFRRLPLTDDELREIAANVAPYFTPVTRIGMSSRAM